MKFKQKQDKDWLNALAADDIDEDSDCYHGPTDVTDDRDRGLEWLYAVKQMVTQMNSQELEQDNTAQTYKK